MYPGFNLLYAPNESGKTTWCTFLQAMFYGLPTKARGAAADKNRYAPWSGAAMEGAMDLACSLGDITITRTTQRPTAPMGAFSAVYTDTTTPVPGLSEDTCGETLLGVPREIFLRSAFIRQTHLSVDQDAQLERRIAALITSGEEDTSFTEAYQRLKKELHRRRYHQSGEIPRLWEELNTRRAARDKIGEIQTKVDALTLEKEQLQRELAALTAPKAVKSDREEVHRRSPLWFVVAAAAVAAGFLLPWQPYAAAAGGFLALALALLGLRKPVTIIEEPSVEDAVPDSREEELTTRLRQVSDALAYAMGQLSAAPSGDALSEEHLTRQIETLELEYDALALAMATLEDANTQLQNRFSPALGKNAGKIFTKLTQGKYNKVLLSKELNVSAGETDGFAPRDVLQISQGAADQLYLAVRLAICDMILPPDVPLILDDALVRFDDTRMAAALDVLMDIAKERQVLCFTCQSRESTYLSTAHAGSYHVVSL